MPNIKITDLPAAVNTTGADVLPIVQNDTTKKASLSLLPIGAATQNALDAKLNSSLLGASNGIATLDSGGKLTSGQIPDIAISEYLGAAANQSAMLALVGQRGDWCSRTDLGTNWVITGLNPAQINDWTQLSYPASPVVSVNTKVGAVVLDKSDVGLGNVENTSDANKPISNATQTALDAKASASALSAHTSDTNNPHATTKTQIGLGNVDNTSDANKPISSATQTALNAKENTITAGTTGQYYRGDKTFQTLDKAAIGLSNVDNTSDINKPISTATQTELNKRFFCDPFYFFANPTGSGNITYTLTSQRYQIANINCSGKTNGVVTIIVPNTGNNNGDVIRFSSNSLNTFAVGVSIAIGYMSGPTFITIGIINGIGPTPYEQRWEWQGIEWKKTADSIFGADTPPLDDNDTAAQTGISPKFARADHQHLAPPVATPSVKGLMSAVDKAFLDSVPAQLQQRVRYLNPTTTVDEFHNGEDSVWVATSYSATDYVVLRDDTVLLGSRLIFNATNQTIFIKTNGSPQKSSLAIPPLCAATITYNAINVSTVGARINHANINYTGSTTLPNATSSNSGLMTSSDFNKLSSIVTPFPTFPNTIVQSSRLPTSTCFIGNSTAFGAQMSVADRHMILIPAIFPKASIGINYYAFRLGSTPLVAAGNIRCGLYNTGPDGLPQNLLHWHQQPLDPLINAANSDVYTGANFGGIGGGYTVNGVGIHWIAFFNCSGNTINLATGTPSSAWLMNAVIGANNILTGSNPEALTTFVLVADGIVMPSSLFSRQFQHSISTASSTTIRYRVTAPALFAQYNVT